MNVQARQISLLAHSPFCYFTRASGSWGSRFCLSASFEPRSEKTGIRGFRPGPTKPNCTATEYGQRLEISDLGRYSLIF